MELTPAQARIALDPHRFRTLCCGRRFGKTTLAIDQIKACAVSGAKRIAYIAPTFQQARDIAWEELKKDCRGADINETRLEIRLVNAQNTESLIILRGWESIETMRGQKFDLVVLDEVASMRNFWLSWQEVIRPTLTDTRGEALFISTPKGYNHFYDLYNLENVDTDYKSFHFTTFDNSHIPVDEIEKARKELTEDRFAQEYLADFRKTEGLVYKEFNRDTCVYADIGEKVMSYNVLDTSVGVDFGFTNPTAIIQIDQSTDGKFFVPREWYKTNKTTPEIIEVARSFQGNYYYPDPAEPDRIEELRRAGLNIREVSKDVEAGINSVRELLKSGRLFIHADCINLINEFETYSYPEKKPERNEPELPIKENDHALDALRYVLYMKAKGSTGFAHTHYAMSSQPTTHTAPQLPNAPKMAYTHIPKRM